MSGETGEEMGATRGEARVQSFEAVSGGSPHTLILGSMPGVKSLVANAYYAHPRNAFWPILIAWLTGREASYTLVDEYTYADRLQRLTGAGLALWDVLAECERRGSLDTAIVRRDARANPLTDFVAAHPTLRHVLFNGRAAADLWRRHVQPSCAALLSRDGRSLSLHTLPSTSPAMASLDLHAKARQWHATLRQAASDYSDARSSSRSDR